jgi:hypothetical protein
MSAANSLAAWADAGPDLLAYLSQETNPSVQRSLLRALARRGTVEDVPILLPWVQSSGVGRDAALAIRTICVRAGVPVPAEVRDFTPEFRREWRGKTPGGTSRPPTGHGLPIPPGGR